jgi:predicted deacylase
MTLDDSRNDAQRLFKKYNFIKNSPMKFLSLLLIFFISLLSQAESSLTYFSTYEDNKHAFLEKAGTHLSQSWYLQSDATLTTDLSFYNYNSDQILVFSSGLHGIEGYVGSSLQRKIMDLLSAKKRLQYDVMILHTLNPWGMRHKRRVNEFNVDMNRTFSNDGKLFSEKNDDYLKIDSFLNPAEKLSLGFFQRAVFLFQAVRLILENGMEILRKSILVGQYTQNKGLYFGGQKLNPIQNKIDVLFQNDLKKYKKVVWIDLHTGYGARGQLHLLTNESDSDKTQKLAALFSRHKIDSGNQKNFYKSKGDLADYLNSKSTQEQDVKAIVFEYGTMDSQTTLGSVESLRRMVIENQGFHNGFIDTVSEKETAALFQNMFFPQDELWKKMIYDQTLQVLNPFLKEVSR